MGFLTTGIELWRYRVKIKTRELEYDKVLSLDPYVHQRPKKQSVLFRKLIQVLSVWDLWRVHFKYEKIGMEKLGKNEPCLILMNHSSFIDLKIVASLFADRPYQIVCTLDGLIGKKWLMRNLGCIPTKKFITDTALVKDMVYSVKHLKS